MNGGATRAARWKLRISAIVWFVLALAFLLCVPTLFALSPLIVTALAVLALLLAFPVAWLVRRLFKTQRSRRFLSSLVVATIALFFLLTTLVAAPIYYLALRTELTVPQATLTNGDKTLVFQGMMHIGSEGFYKSVVYDLEKALVDGYVVYYEGVRASPEGDKWFSDTLAGGGDLSSNYKAFAGVCGLQFQQDYFGLLRADMAAHPERHVAADVSTGDMMREYQRLIQSDPAFAAEVASRPAPAPDQGADATDELTGIVSWLQQGNDARRDIAGIACRGLMTMLMSRAPSPDLLDPVILDYRNRALTERIESEPSKLIYMTYGAGHLPGLLALLQASDPDWQIASLKWMRPIEGTEKLDGKL